MTTADQFKPIDNSHIHQYLKNKMARQQYTFSITCNGEAFYNFENGRISEDEFNNIFPLQSLSRDKKGQRIGNSQTIY